jgi:hypothetical protein
VDDQPTVRRGLKMRFVIEEDMQVFSEAGDAPRAARP